MHNLSDTAASRSIAAGLGTSRACRIGGNVLALVLVLAACGNNASDGGDSTAEGPSIIESIDASTEGPVGETTADLKIIDVPSAQEAAAAALAASELFLEANAEKEGVLVTESGLQYKISREGDGPNPKATDVVTVHYRGSKTDGQEFDSSYIRKEPVTFPLSQVVPGWTEGLQLLKEGSIATFFLPPALAYGAEGTPGGPIGPNEVLIFDVELIEVIDPETNQARLAEVEAEQRAKIEAVMAELAEKNLAASNAFFSQNIERDGVMETESGLQYEVISKAPVSEDDVKSPAPDDTVKVHYHGTLLSGSVFDSSVDRDEPVEFGLDQVIPGWTEGLQLMSVGDKFKFFIPPDLAYGPSGNGPIEPNAALTFDVELLDIIAPETPDTE